jgi:pimeloyl-ACP methyl ester carboxylesterase
MLMQLLKLIAALFVFVAMSGCTNMQRLAHVYSGQALAPATYRYQDGGTSLYYSFTVNDSSHLDTFVFFYGGSGCPSWKYVMPGYVDGLSVSARVFALNKRFVTDHSTGMFGCGNDFHLANNPDQWIADYSEFIATQLKAAPSKPKHVVLIGISEGALTAVRVAGLMPEITYIATVGDGGYPMRESLSILKKKGAISFNVEAGWKDIATDPRSIEKKWYGNTYRWWSDVMDIDPTPYFLKLNIPILVGIGEQDESIPVESARFLETTFKETGKNNLILHVYPGADHRLNSNGVSYRREFFAELSRLLQTTHNISVKRDAPQAARPLP